MEGGLFFPQFSVQRLHRGFHFGIFKRSIAHDFKIGRMDDGGNARFMPGLRRILLRDKQVLPVPGFNPVIRPNPPANAVAANVAAVVELFLPMLRPLAVHVVLAVLAGRCGGKNNSIAMRRQGGRKMVDPVHLDETETAQASLARSVRS